MNTKKIKQTGILLLSIISMSAYADKFGTLCQEDFEEEDGKESTISYTYSHCSKFNSKMDSIRNTSKKFYQFIDSSNESGWSPSNDDNSGVGGIDTVDLVFVSSHGNSTKDYSLISKYGYQDRHYSTNWEFGNNTEYLDVLAMYACSTMRIDSTRYSSNKDGVETDHGGQSYQYTRFKTPLRTGMKLVLGAYDSMYGGYWRQNEGRNFANYLKSGHSLQYAWRKAYRSHHPNTMATGKTSSNCNNRRSKLKWKNLNSYSRITGSDNKYFCQRWGF